MSEDTELQQQEAQQSHLLFQFSLHQLTLLRTIHATEAAKKLSVRFEDPADDGKTIRQIAYLDGGIDLLKYLLDFDDQVREQQEASKRQLLESQAGNDEPAQFNQPGF